jgi:hypothetical protein
MLLTDKPLLLCVGLWAAVVVFLIYGPVHTMPGGSQ